MPCLSNSLVFQISDQGSLLPTCIVKPSYMKEIICRRIVYIKFVNFFLKLFHDSSKCAEVKRKEYTQEGYVKCQQLLELGKIQDFWNKMPTCHKKIKIHRPTYNCEYIEKSIIKQ